MYRLLSFAASERGAALAEWGLLVVLIAVLAMLAVTLAGGEVSETYSEIASNLVDAGS
ncbi:MAG: Flp family type IVb pilin [Acidimicrobiia bacterium]